MANEHRAATVRGTAQSLTQDVSVGPHALRSDVPGTLGGQDQGPEPFELLSAALGTCTSLTVTLYARRKQWPLEGIEVTVQHRRQEVAGKPADRFERAIKLRGPLDADQKARLMEIADKCPVHKTLSAGAEVVTR